MPQEGMSQESVSERRRGKANQAEAAFVRLLSESSRRGFYGNVSLTLSVQDGFIQHVRVATDQLMK